MRQHKTTVRFFLVYEIYVNPETAIINHEGKDYQNLILIYMESMEANFARTEKDNQNLIPFLDDIAKKNVSFAHFEEGYAQNWTQGALFSSMSGIPINYLSSDFSWSNYVSTLITSFGKNIYTLPQILKKYGYTNILVQGSDISFSGLDTFLFSHGYSKENIYDLNYIRKENPNFEDLKYWWGIQDKDTYKVFKEKIETLAKNKKPFFATMFTIDTHRGVFPKSPDTPFNDKAKNTIYQASILVKDFIDWEQSQDFAKNTTIVIIGDHLRMYDEHGKFINEYKEGGRRIYNVFINSKILPKTTERHFTQMDMFPSLLECIGFRVKDGKLGLGRSLFSENKTLSEEFGTENLNHQLIKRNKLYEKLWKE